MSTKSYTLGLLGGIAATVSDAKDNTQRSFSGSNRRAVVMARSGSPSIALSRIDTRLYLGVGLAAAVALMFLVYVFGINQSAAKGYEITRQKAELNALIEENKKLLVRTAEIGSIVQIQDQAAADHLVQINNQEYLQLNQLSQR